MEVQLTEVDSSRAKRTFVLDKLPVTIGQGPDAVVHLDDQWVSRRHCEIHAVKGTLVVRDLGSMLGTFVNGLNVTTAALMPGDKLTIGVASFVVDYERPAITPAPAHPEPQRLSVEVHQPPPEETDRRPRRLLFFRLPRRLLPFLGKRRSER